MKKSKILENDWVIIMYNYQQECVIVYCKQLAIERYFAGWDELQELFEAMFENFTRLINFNDAVSFFKPSLPKNLIGHDSTTK